MQYCTGSYLSITPVDQLGKQLDVRFYYVAFTLSQGSLHQPGRSLHLNITNVANFCFNPVQFYDSSIPFEFQSICKKIFHISFWLYLQKVLHIQCDGVLLLNIVHNKIFYTATSYLNDLIFTPIAFLINAKNIPKYSFRGFRGVNV